MASVCRRAAAAGVNVTAEGAASKGGGGAKEADRLCAALQQALLESRARALSIQQQAAVAEEAASRDGRRDGTAEGGGGASDPGERVCTSCGQPVSDEHLASRRAELRAQLTAADAAAATCEELVAAARSATDTIRYLELQSECASAEHAAAGAAGAAAAARAACDEQIRALERLRKRAADDGAQTGESDRLRAELEQLQVSRAAAQAEAAAWTQRRHAAEMRAEKHRVALEALAALERAPNPHALRIGDAAARRAAVASRQEKLAVAVKGAKKEETSLSALSEHFGKRGVQNLLYKLALENLERRAKWYAGELSGGKLQLRLAFDEAQKTVKKEVRMRRAEGGWAERSVAQLSGGEWRRLALALSLAFADFAKQRTALGCNLLVLDEVMAHMDAEGQRAMASVLQELGGGIDTVLVIAHGLRDENLYGLFDAVDTVEKVADASQVRIGDELRL